MLRRNGIYSSAIPLLLQYGDEIKRTFFIFGYGTPINVMKHLRNQSVCFDEGSQRNRAMLAFFKKIRALWLFERWVMLFRIPRIKKSDTLFAQDHLALASYICAHDYTLIEDSPHIFTNVDNDGLRVQLLARLSLKQSRLRRMLYGSENGLKYGMSKHCKRLLLTQDDPSEYVRGIPREVVNIKHMWAQSSEEKRQYILSVFNLTAQDISTFRGRDIVIFTQPLYPDRFSQDEAIEIYKHIVGKYPHEELIIKPHPRDNAPYNKLFPDIPIFTKPVPSQLLELEGVRFKKIVTVNSTAVYDFNDSVDIDWYGENEFIQSKMGRIMPPVKANLCKL